MNTLCHKQLDFGSLFGKQIWADFEGGQITSDAGALLLGEIDKRYGVCEVAAQCIDERRDAERITHEMRSPRVSPKYWFIRQMPGYHYVGSRDAV